MLSLTKFKFNKDAHMIDLKREISANMNMFIITSMDRNAVQSNFSLSVAIFDLGVDFS